MEPSSSSAFDPAPPASAPAPASSSAWASSSASASSSAEATVIEALLKRGWSFDNAAHVRAVITIQRALIDDPSDAAALADAVESDLLNTDLRSVGSRSLPDRKASHLHGPIVLQVEPHARFLLGYGFDRFRSVWCEVVFAFGSHSFMVR